jgi:hypothetical protein
MATITALFILTAGLVLKHFLKAKLYIDDTFNYAFAGATVWTRKSVDSLLFDVAARSNTTSSPPFYPTIYKYVISRTKLSPLIVQSFFDWLAQTALFSIVLFEFSLIPAVIAVVVFNLSPLVFKDTLYYTDRLWATTVLWINFWSLDNYIFNGGTIFLIVGIISYCLLILSHKHSFQMLLIAYFVLSIVFSTSVFLLAAISGELLTVVITHGYSWEVHKSHFQLLRFGWKYLFPKGPGGYGQDQLLFLRKNASSATVNKSTAILVRSVTVNWDFVLYTGALILILFSPMASQGGNRFYTYGFLFVTVFATALITRNTRRLKFIGESNRYLQYAAFPAVMAIWPICLAAGSAMKLLMLAFLVFWGLGALYLDIKTLHEAAKNIVNLIDPDFEKLVAFVRAKSWDRFIVFPIQKTYAFSWLAQKKILHFLGAKGFRQARDWFPQIQRPIPSFYDEYNINYIVLDERYVKPGELDLGDVREIHRENSWVVLEINRQPEVAST